MPAIAALSINDGQSTPVAHTFNPTTTDGSRAEFADRSPTIASGFRKFSHEITAPNGQRTTYKIAMGWMIPVVATVNGVDQVVRYSSAQLVLNAHPDSTAQERKDLLAYVVNAASNASVKTSVENIEPFY